MNKFIPVFSILVLVLLACNTPSRRNCNTIGKRFAELSSRLDKVKGETSMDRNAKLRKLKELSEQATRLANDFEGCQIDKKETTLGDQVGQFVDEFRVNQLKEDVNRAYENFKNTSESLSGTTENPVTDWEIRYSIKRLEDRIEGLLSDISLDKSGNLVIEGQQVYIESITISDTPTGLLLQCNDGNNCFQNLSNSTFLIQMDSAKAKRISAYLNDYKQLVVCFHSGGKSCSALVKQYSQ